MTKSERILKIIPKLNELTDSDLNTVIKVAEACNIMQLLKTLDSKNIKRIVNEEVILDGIN